MRYIHIPTATPVECDRELDPALYRKVDGPAPKAEPKPTPKRRASKPKKAAE